MIEKSKTRENWKSTDVLIIDEVSILDSTLLDNLSKLATFHRNINRVFGGIQHIFFRRFASTSMCLNCVTGLMNDYLDEGAVAEESILSSC